MPTTSSESKTSILPRINSAFSAYPGQIYIMTGGAYYFGAPDGGGHIDDTAIQTDIRYAPGEMIGAWLKFTVWRDFAGHFALQTSGGNFITAVSGGGRSSDVIHTDATDIAAWEEFQIASFDGVWSSIQTTSKNFLTAVGGGGHQTDAIHSDAVTVSDWETFQIRKAGDLGSGFQYYLIPTFAQFFSDPLVANNGGDLTQNALGAYTQYPVDAPLSWAWFTLIQQANGSYGVQTSSGNFVTAVNGGGLDYGNSTLQTNRVEVQAWEQFRFIEIGDSTYAIQTVSGNYLGVSDEWEFSTNTSDINAAAKFWLVPVSFFQQL